MLAFLSVMPEEERLPSADKKGHTVYDDATLERMKEYYKIEGSHDDLLKYIKSRGVRRHIDLLDES